MTFSDYLAAHPDPTVQAAREWLRERAGGPRTLREALDDMDAAGAPGVASLAIREAWEEWTRRPRMAAHDFAQMVNNLRDIGRQYGAAGQLRDRIAWELARWIEVGAKAKGER